MAHSQPPAEDRYRRILSKRREGESIRALARRHGVKHQTLYWWKSELGRRDRERQEQLQEVVPVDLPGGLLGLGSIMQPGFEVALQQSGHVVRVPSRFDADALRALVDVLEGR